MSNVYAYDYQPYYKECLVCKRRILVEIVQFGISHIGAVNAICADCVLKSPMWEDFKKGHPTEAQDINEWVVNKDS